jgi:hypothetical protein
MPRGLCKSLIFYLGNWVLKLFAFCSAIIVLKTYCKFLQTAVFHIDYVHPSNVCQQFVHEQTNDSGEKAISITLQKHLVPAFMLMFPASIACAATNNANGRKNSYGTPIGCSLTSKPCFAASKVIWVFGLSFIIKKSGLTVTCS